MKSIVLLLVLTISQSAPLLLHKQENPQKETRPTQEAPKSISPVSAPEGEPTPKAETSEAKDKPSGWPSRGDVFWPSWALVIVTIVAVRAALKTLGSINAQVDEMRKTGEQTDKLISENIAQSTSMQKSVAESARMASAMELVSKEMAVSSKAALASVSSINQQMRAYLCVVIGTALYQERANNIKFQASPSMTNAGLTPAHKVSYKLRAAILPIPLPADFTFPLPDAFIPGSVIGPRQSSNVSPLVDDFCDDSEVEGIKKANEGKALYTWGIVSYEDVFGSAHFTKFSQIYTWLPDGKIYGYYTDRHNEIS